VLITHFRYNAFLIRERGAALLIDPGQSLGLLNFRSLVPGRLWAAVTHVLVTHGDPDHYWQADRVARRAGAPLVMHRSMIRQDGHHGTRILAPRRPGLRFQPYRGETVALTAGEEATVGGITIAGLPTQHGRIRMRVLGITYARSPGESERVGYGSLGYRIRIGGRSVVTLGDSLLQREWAGLEPDLLMLPIGGLGNHSWTMDVDEAVEAVRIIAPAHVIPCHYDLPFLWYRHAAAADVSRFKARVEELGIACSPLDYGEELALD
jgi:L-ascorbate metabolism protein UlaG (beta-lactamase superfamily)